MKITLVGNGRSLRDAPQPKGDCMGVNKIHLSHIEVTHYVKVDLAFGEPWKDQVLPHLGKKCLLWDAFRNGLPQDHPNHEDIPDGIGEHQNVTWVKRCKHHYHRPGTKYAMKEWHLPSVCTAYNSISVMMQWAVLLGYDEIDLIGCDGNFTNPKEDHFTEDYYDTWDSDYQERNNENVRIAHQIASVELEKLGVKVTDKGGGVWPG